MTSIHDFVVVQARLVLANPAPELIAEQLTVACVEILPVDGATLTLFSSDAVPMPIGTSGRDAAVAEGLQFTTAQGPCREAWATGNPVIADEMAIAARWPLFHDELMTLSPFRAMVSTPLRHGLGRSGTLNLFLRNDSGFADLNLEDIHQVNDLVSQELLLALTPTAGRNRGWLPWVVQLDPFWLDSPDVARRSAVFIAIGLLRAALNVNEQDALALLRARAFTTGQTVDDTALALAELRLNTTDLDPYSTPGAT